MSLTAEYHGTCADCEEPIVPGQLIERADDEGWQHADCHALPEAAPCVCERCFLVHAPRQEACW